MNLKIGIHKIKHIKDAEFTMRLTRGLYAITGENGTGKSTIVTCASSSFFNMQMNEYIGTTEDDANITLVLSDGSCVYSKKNGRWRRKFKGTFKLNTRVRDTDSKKRYSLELA